MISEQQVLVVAKNSDQKWLLRHVGSVVPVGPEAPANEMEGALEVLDNMLGKGWRLVSMSGSPLFQRSSTLAEIAFVVVVERAAG